MHVLERIFRPWEFQHSCWHVTFCAVWISHFAVHRCCFCFRERGLSSYTVKLAGTFRFGSWKNMLDPCTWSLPRLSLRVVELGAPGKLGAPELQSEKRRGKLLNMLNTLSFLARSWKNVFLQCLAFEHGTFLCIVVVSSGKGVCHHIR